MDRDFAEKRPQAKVPPNYGPFKVGDRPHTGYNKTIGKNPYYKEDPLVDPIAFKKDMKGPIWKVPVRSFSKPMISVHDNFKN